MFATQTCNIIFGVTTLITPHDIDMASSAIVWCFFALIARIVATDRATTPYETQSAQCTITAGDVQASAQATISKRLEGVCGSGTHITTVEIPPVLQLHFTMLSFSPPTVQLAHSLELLEQRVSRELSEIRRILLAQMAHAGQAHHFWHTAPPSVGNYMELLPQDPSAEPAATDVSTTPEPTTTQLPPAAAGSATTTGAPVTAQTLISTTTTTLPPASSTATERTIHFQPVQMRSLTSPAAATGRKRVRTRPRELEVARFNNTLLRGDEIRIFSYYWRIENFQQQLLANVSQIDSPVFAISGLRLCVHAVLNHLNRDYLYLQLQSVPHANRAPRNGTADADDDDGDDDENVVLETGTMFREIETREYFRHKIVILDQETPTKDLVSQEFFNTKSGFQVPNSAIVSGPYAKDSAILIKVVIYL